MIISNQKQKLKNFRRKIKFERRFIRSVRFVPIVRLYLQNTESRLNYTDIGYFLSGKNYNNKT